MIEDAWARAVPQGAAVTAGYARIENRGGDDRLVSASTPAAVETQIHTVDFENGIMRMRELEDGLPLPAAQTVELRPGSFHIMLMQPTRELSVGDEIPVTLSFEHADAITVDFTVRPIGAER